MSWRSLRYFPRPPTSCGLEDGVLVDKWHGWLRQPTSTDCPSRQQSFHNLGTDNHGPHHPSRAKIALLCRLIAFIYYVQLLDFSSND